MPIDDDPAYHIGALTGRLVAVEDRIGRHETFVGKKLDELSMDIKNLAASINQNAGKNQIWNIIWMFIASLASGGLFVVFHK